MQNCWLTDTESWHECKKLEKINEFYETRKFSFFIFLCSEMEPRKWSLLQNKNDIGIM
jgi:hypothetical protein